MKTDHFSFRSIPQEELAPLVSHRHGEAKVGEALAADHTDAACKYVVLGICEDIGPRANHGQPGSRHAFDAFLPALLNMQANRFLDAKQVHVLGRIDANDPDEELDLPHLRARVAELDGLVQQVVQPIMEAGKIPIVIGGGHNNAYPLIKSAKEVLGAAVNVVSLDAHADCRALEGRHSGNSFSYGLAEKLINRYTVFGLHMARNNEAILEFMDEFQAEYTFLDDYLDMPGQFSRDVASFSRYTVDGEPICVELDLDTIKDMPSSAMSPTGVTLEQAREYLRAVTGATISGPGPRPRVVYVHLPEGAPRTAAERATVGKALAYLVYDVVARRED